jgi:hypothetical protein
LYDVDSLSNTPSLSTAVLNAQYEVDTDGTNTMTLIHDLDEKWSLFLKNWIEQGMKTTVGIILLFDVSKNSVIVRFHIA